MATITTVAVVTCTVVWGAALTEFVRTWSVLKRR